MYSATSTPAQYKVWSNNYDSIISTQPFIMLGDMIGSTARGEQSPTSYRNEFQTFKSEIKHLYTPYQPI